MTPRNWTHSDAGLWTALAELQSRRYLERYLPAIVLLTDGVRTGTPGEELRAAPEVQNAGVRLYVIGLGADVDAGDASLGSSVPRRQGADILATSRDWNTASRR